MSRSWFPDLFGPSRVAANGGASVGARKRVLNIASSGATLTDNAAKRRTDLFIQSAAWSVRSDTLLVPGEQMPVSTTYATVDLIRLNASGAGSIVVGFDSGADPTRLVKFVANVGSVAFTLAPPTTPIAGKQYIAGASYTLNPNGTARVVWDAVSRVYRVKGTSVAPPVTDHIVLDGDTLALDGDQISNPL